MIERCKLSACFSFVEESYFSPAVAILAKFVVSVASLRVYRRRALVSPL